MKVTQEDRIEMYEFALNRIHATLEFGPHLRNSDLGHIVEKYAGPNREAMLIRDIGILKGAGVWPLEGDGE